MDGHQLQQRISMAVFAFRGYNVKNLGRSDELLEHREFAPVVEKRLKEASEVCSEITRRRVDLVDRVRHRRETTLASYSEAISLVVAMELAQIDLLGEFFGISYRKGRFAFGYSLGEVAALCAGGVLEMAEVLRPPLTLADDCVALATDVTLGVLFSRGPLLPTHEVERLCLQINYEGRGVIGVSTYLAPNSLLLMGQGDTLDRFKRHIPEAFPDRVYLRKNDERWPPLHTPIMWERSIPNRSAVMMHTMKGGFVKPQPAVFSLVTGALSYNELNVRHTLHRWVDEPQRLWDAVLETLSQGVEIVIHVGPGPNIIPATFRRLSENVASQIKARLGVRAMSEMVARPWLKALLPARAALLRAPLIQQIILEDWLLEQKV